MSDIAACNITLVCACWNTNFTLYHFYTVHYGELISIISIHIRLYRTPRYKEPLEIRYSECYKLSYYFKCMLQDSVVSFFNRNSNKITKLDIPHIGTTPTMMFHGSDIVVSTLDI